MTKQLATEDDHSDIFVSNVTCISGSKTKQGNPSLRFPYFVLEPVMHNVGKEREVFDHWATHWTDDHFSLKRL